MGNFFLCILQIYKAMQAMQAIQARQAIKSSHKTDSFRVRQN